MENPVIVVALAQLRVLIEDAVSRAVRDEVARLIRREDEPEWLTARQVAAELGISRSTVSRWTKSGKLAAYKMAGTVRYRRADVTALLERGG